MAKNDYYICRSCGKQILKSEAIPHDTIKGYYFCSDKCKKKGISALDQARDYLYRKFPNHDFQFLIFNRQYNQLKKNGYKEKGILLTLYYCYDILDLDIDGNGLSVVEFFYSEAKKHYEQVLEHKQMDKAKLFNDPIVYLNPNNSQSLSLLKYKMKLERRKKNDI